MWSELYGLPLDKSVQKCQNQRNRLEDKPNIKLSYNLVYATICQKKLQKEHIHIAWITHQNESNHPEVVLVFFKIIYLEILGHFRIFDDLEGDAKSAKNAQN